MAPFFIHRPVFAWVLAIATMLLGDQGAEVIKVEPPGGDPVRRLGRTRGGITPTFATANSIRPASASSRRPRRPRSITPSNRPCSSASPALPRAPRAT